MIIFIVYMVIIGLKNINLPYVQLFSYIIFYEKLKKIRNSKEYKKKGEQF
jgi:hypothetical protein